MMEEIWRNIDGYEGLYQISNYGRVKSLNYKGKVIIMKPYKDKYGYLRVCLQKNGNAKKYFVHRLVVQAFIDNPYNLPEVNHKDENPSNNCVDNLEWCNRKYNNNYGTRTKRVVEKRSKPTYQYTLDDKFVKEWKSLMDIQRQMGFAAGHISQCCNGQRKTAYGYKWTY